MIVPSNLYVSRLALINYSANLQSQMDELKSQNNTKDLCLKINNIINELKPLKKQYQSFADPSLKAQLTIYPTLSQHLDTLKKIISSDNTRYSYSTKNELDLFIKDIDCEMQGPS